MTRCADCGAVLLADGTCRVCGGDRQQPADVDDEPASTPDSQGPSQSITIEGSDIEGGVTNDAATGGSTADEGSQSITVRESRIDGAVANRWGGERTGQAAELADAAAGELAQRREALREATAASDSPPVAQLLAALDDPSAIESLQQATPLTDPDADEAAEATDPVPVAHTLDAIAEVDRLAAEEADLKALYKAIEKVVRLLTELETPVEEELQAFVDRQRILTDGSPFEAELTPSARASLESLCDQAREAVVRHVRKS